MRHNASPAIIAGEAKTTEATSSRSAFGSATLRRKCACGGNPGADGSCGECERKRVRRSTPGPSTSGIVPESVHHVLRSPGRALDAGSRDFFASRFGHDFSHVRIHDDVQAARSALDVDARAYTVGAHVAFGTGQYAPQSQAGRSLLAHELAHVVQARDDALRAATLTLDGGPTDPLEVEAGRAASDVMAGRVPRIALRGGGGRLHRRGIVDEPAGGCGACKDPMLVGTEIHQLVQMAFPRTHQNEATFAIPPSPGDENGRLDLLHVVLDPGNPPSTVEVGEIKPNNVSGVKDGARDLAFYMTALRVHFPPPFWEVEPMLLPPPAVALTYHDGISPRCPPQAVSVINSGGLYLYDCNPTRNSIRSCCQQPVPPPPVPVEKDVKEGDKKKVDDKEKDKDKEDDKEKPPIGPPIPVPANARDIALLLAALAAMGAIASKLGKAGRARVLGYAAAVAAVILVANGAEASIGLEGDDAFEALFKLAEAKGQTIPDDVKEAIRNDPKLKDALTRGAKSGNFDEAQRQAGERMARVLAEHSSEFSAEELDVLLKATEGVKGSVPTADVTVEELKRQIELKKKGGGGSSGGQGPGGSGTPGGGGSGGKDAGPPSADPATDQPPPPPPLEGPASRLEEALRKGEKRVHLDRAQLTELREILGTANPPLTDAEVDALISQTASAEGTSAQEVLDSVRNGIDKLRQPAAASVPDATKSGGDGGDASGEKPDKKAGAGAGGMFPAPVETDEKKVPKPNAADKAEGETYAKVLEKQKDRFQFVAEGQAVLLSPKKVTLGKPYTGFLVIRMGGQLCMGRVSVTPLRKISGKDTQIRIAGGSKLYGQNGKLCSVTTATNTTASDL
jgi:hypothetical protein